MKRSALLKSSLALSAAALAAKSADAAIIYSGTVDLIVTNDQPVAFDLDNDGTDDYEFLFGNNEKTKPSVRTTDFKGVNGINLVFAQDTAHTLPVTPAGLSIDSSFAAGLSNAYTETWFYQNWDKNAYGNWYDGSETVTGYVGFAIPRDGGTDYNYGWAQFSVNVDGKFMELHDFAYETDLNTAIITGAVPEPTSTALLLTGAAGLLALRKRRARRA